MIKKIPIPFLIIAMVLQIIAPVAMMIYSSGLDKLTLEKGTEYKFAVTLDYISQDEDGKNRLYFTAETDYYREKKERDIFVSDFGEICSDSYLQIEPADDGYFLLKLAPLGKGRPNEYVYKNRPHKFPFYGFVETDIYYHSNFFWKNAPGEAYATVKIYKGNAIVTAVYADGVPVNEWLESKFTPTDGIYTPNIPMEGTEVPEENEYFVDLDNYGVS